MRVDDDTLLYLGLGPLVAVALGITLIPLRELTSASNLTFAFLAWTIIVGEVGGRSAAVATAVAAALSLNFFLTRPYLSLAIHGASDVIAFLGLAVCGVLAASLGSRRRERLAARQELEQLHAVVSQIEYGGPIESRLAPILAATRSAFPLSALVVRDADGRALAASPDSARERPASPSTVVRPDSLVPGGRVAFWPGRAVPLPEAGVRVALVAANRQQGWLEVWGDGRPAGPESRRALSAVARVVAALLAVAVPASGERE